MYIEGRKVGDVEQEKERGRGRAKQVREGETGSFGLEYDYIDVKCDV